jgi:hypothetical protein
MIIISLSIPTPNCFIVYYLTCLELIGRLASLVLFLFLALSLKLFSSMLGMLVSNFGFSSFSACFL